jgi:hypothetical protein
VEVFLFFRWLLVIAASVSLLWPVNVLFAALAYKVRTGQRPIDMDAGPFWTRSTFAGLGLALLAGLAVLLDVLLVRAGLPVGVTHVIVILLYTPVAVWFLFWIYALDEMPEGASVLLLFVFLPGLPMSLLWWFGLPVALADAWVAPVPVT